MLVSKPRIATTINISIRVKPLALRRENRFFRAVRYVSFMVIALVAKCYGALHNTLHVVEASLAVGFDAV